MPARRCVTAGCPNLATWRGRCPGCNREREAGIRRHTNIYNTKRWRVLRSRHLFENPLCAECGEVATDVHHKVPITEGGEPWARSNLESLCHSCHSRETRREQLAR